MLTKYKALDDMLSMTMQRDRNILRLRCNCRNIIKKTEIISMCSFAKGIVEGCWVSNALTWHETKKLKHYINWYYSKLIEAYVKGD